MSLTSVRSIADVTPALAQIRVCLVDEDALMAQAVASALMLSPTPRIRVLTCSEKLEVAIVEIRRSWPDLLILSGPAFLSGHSELSQQLAVHLRHTRLAVFADGFTDAQLERALAHEHVGGLFSKRSPLPEFVASCFGLVATGFEIAPPLRDRLPWEPGQRRPRVKSPNRPSTLTGRQIEVLIRFASGDGVREVAAKLQISEKAVESHKYRIMHRLGINNRVQLCRWAIREGLILP